MNYIQYLQSGGKTTPSIQKQVVALVQAAVQGDQQAVAQIQKILQAAKSGDKQALQIAQMIQTVMQKMKGTQMQQAGGEMQPQQPVQRPQPQYGNAPIPPPVPQQQDNTSMGTQIYGNSSAAPLSKNDYGAPENNAIDQAISGAVQNFGGSALSAIGSMRRGGKTKFFEKGGKDGYINEIKGSRRDLTPKEKEILMEMFKEKTQNWDPFLKNDSSLIVPDSLPHNGDINKIFKSISDYKPEFIITEDGSFIRKPIENELLKPVEKSVPRPYYPGEGDKIILFDNKEKGGKLNKRCSCKLERRGGKIVQVDSCTGLIIK